MAAQTKVIKNNRCITYNLDKKVNNEEEEKENGFKNEGNISDIVKGNKCCGNNDNKDDIGGCGDGLVDKLSKVSISNCNKKCVCGALK